MKVSIISIRFGKSILLTKGNTEKMNACTCRYRSSGVTERIGDKCIFTARNWLTRVNRRFNLARVKSTYRHCWAQSAVTPTPPWSLNPPLVSTPASAIDVPLLSRHAQPIVAPIPFLPSISHVPQLRLKIRASISIALGTRKR